MLVPRIIPYAVTEGPNLIGVHQGTVPIIAKPKDLVSNKHNRLPGFRASVSCGASPNRNIYLWLRISGKGGNRTKLDRASANRIGMVVNFILTSHAGNRRIIGSHLSAGQSPNARSHVHQPSGSAIRVSGIRPAVETTAILGASFRYLRHNRFLIVRVRWIVGIGIISVVALLALRWPASVPRPAPRPLRLRPAAFFPAFAECGMNVSSQDNPIHPT